MLDRRLVIVGGKGGVGRSTVAAALGLTAARHGLVTLVAEVAGQGDVARLLGAEPAKPLQEARLAPHLHHMTLEQQPALEEYLREEVPGPFPATILARSRAFRLFVEAAPGLSELLTIGKVWELTQHPRHRREARTYDLVILDAPASGQLAGLLGAPQTFEAIARVGPVASQARAIQQLVRDPALTATIAVTTPEQMPVSETLGLDRTLQGLTGRRLDGVVVNRLFPVRFSDAEARRLAGAGDDPPVRSALWFHGRARAQRAQLSRLEHQLTHVSRWARLPFLFTDRPGREAVDRLAGDLGPLLP